MQMEHHAMTDRINDTNLSEVDEIKNSFYEDMPDYTQYKNGAELINALGDEGMKWAAAFCQYTKKNLDIDLDLMYVMGWFANAIEHSNVVRQWRREAAERDSA